MANVSITIRELHINVTAPSDQADVAIDLEEFSYEVNDVNIDNQTSILEGFARAFAQVVGKYV